MAVESMQQDQIKILQNKMINSKKIIIQMKTNKIFKRKFIEKALQSKKGSKFKITIIKTLIKLLKQYSNHKVQIYFQSQEPWITMLRVIFNRINSKVHNFHLLKKIIF